MVHSVSQQPGYVSLISIAEDHDQKKLGEERVYLATGPDHSPLLKEAKLKQGRNLETGTEAEMSEEHCSLS